jgi:hypothetical protein
VRLSGIICPHGYGSLWGTVQKKLSTRIWRGALDPSIGVRKLVLNLDIRDADASNINAYWTDQFHAPLLALRASLGAGTLIA